MFAQVRRRSVVPRLSTVVHSGPACVMRCRCVVLPNSAAVLSPGVHSIIHCCPSRMRAMSSLTWSKMTWRSVICCLILSTAYMTVVWSRPPNASAMRG